MEVQPGLNVPVGALSPGLFSGGWWTRWARWLTQASLGAVNQGAMSQVGSCPPTSSQRILGRSYNGCPAA